MNALDRIPDNVVTPQYDFLGRSVAPAKAPIRVPSFLSKAEGDLFVAKPLRTHVCVVDRQAYFIESMKCRVANDHRPGRLGRLESVVDFRIMVE